MATWGLLLTVFLGALASGWHCALMCGGISASVEAWHRGQEQSIDANHIGQTHFFSGQLLMHLGRLATYGLLGGLAGFLGFGLWRQDFLPIQRGLFALAAVLFCIQGIRLLRVSKSGLSAWELWLNQRAAGFWAQLHRRISGISGYSARWWQGMVWGLVPCGLVYSVLPLAFLSGDALSGALLMGAFGLGTLPNLLLLSAFTAKVAEWGHRAWMRYLAAALMLITGGWGLYRAITLPDSMIKGGFCISETLNYNTYLIG